MSRKIREITGHCVLVALASACGGATDIESTPWHEALVGVGGTSNNESTTSAGGDSSAGNTSSAGGDTKTNSSTCSAEPLEHNRLAVGDAWGCALDEAGNAGCWGKLDNELSAFSGSFAHIAGSGSSICGVSERGTIACSREGGSREVTYIDVATYTETCAIDECGKVDCWESSTQPSWDAPKGTFTKLDAGYHFFCGIQDVGTLVCWGNDSNEYGQQNPPNGAFKSVSLGDAHACAIRGNGTVRCWGIGGADDPLNGSDPNGRHWGQANAPSGNFLSVSAGAYHTCGVREDGTLECWGAGKAEGDCKANLDECGMAAPPEGTFVQVASGFTHSCAITADAKVRCWGSDSDGRSSPPADFR